LICSGKFRPELKEFGGKYVKNEYYEDGEAPERSIERRDSPLN